VFSNTCCLHVVRAFYALFYITEIFFKKNRSAKEKSVERGESSRGQNCYRQEIIDLEDSDKVLEETCSSRQENDEQVTERSHSSREQRHDLAFEGTSSRRLDSGDLKFSSEDTEGLFMNINLATHKLTFYLYYHLYVILFDTTDISICSFLQTGELRLI